MKQGSLPPRVDLPAPRKAWNAKRFKLICGIIVVSLFVARYMHEGPWRIGALESANAEDSSVDPPERNPHPTQRVELHVSAPPSLKVRVGADYRVGTWLGMFGGGGEYCGPDVNARGDAIGHALPGTTVPIDLKWNGSAYEGAFFLDNFLPGRCHWRFFSLNTLSPANGSVSLYEEYFKKYTF